MNDIWFLHSAGEIDQGSHTEGNTVVCTLTCHGTSVEEGLRSPERTLFERDQSLCSHILARCPSKMYRRKHRRAWQCAERATAELARFDGP
jgi:hypothetical protein